MRVTFLSHARDQMREKDIPEERVRAVLANPDREYPSYKGRILAEKVFAGEHLAVKVVYNSGLEEERIVVTVTRGRPGRS